MLVLIEILLVSGSRTSDFFYPCKVCVMWIITYINKNIYKLTHVTIILLCLDLYNMIIITSQLHYSYGYCAKVCVIWIITDINRNIIIQTDSHT